MVDDVHGIPYPPDGEPITPDTLLIALVGFDGQGYRLGYGGGYYDRMLAALPTKPETIGVGFDLGRLASIHPQPHDIPLDVIVTERGWWRRSAG
jgi:5-formyltetrahydrofolate cyclo-ligase